MVLDRNKLKKPLKEKGVKDLDDFNAFMRDISKDFVETLLEEELTDHLGFEKHDQKTNGKKVQKVVNLSPICHTEEEDVLESLHNLSVYN